MSSLDDVSTLRDRIQTLEKEIEMGKEFDGWWSTEKDNLDVLINKIKADNKEFNQLLSNGNGKRSSFSSNAGASMDSQRNSFDEGAQLLHEEQINSYVTQLADLGKQLNAEQEKVI